jgi:hypothetical protein
MGFVEIVKTPPEALVILKTILRSKDMTKLKSSQGAEDVGPFEMI